MNKIKPNISIKDFKKHKPRVLKIEDPEVLEEKMQQKAHIRKVTAAVSKRNIPKPVKIPVKKPTLLKRIREVKPSLPVQPQVQAVKEDKRQEQQVKVRPKQTYNRPDLSVLRKKAIERGKVSRKDPRIIKQKEAVRRSDNRQIRKIENLKDIGTNRVLIVVAAGPSVKQIDLTPLKDHPLIDFMCINKPYPEVWPSKFWSFCDYTQQRRNVDAWNKYEGIILNSYNVKARKNNQILFRSRSGQGFSLDVSKGYHIGRSSTYASMQVIHYMNYKRAYFFGVDMGPDPDSGKLYHYGSGENPDVAHDRRMSRFPMEAKHYNWAGKNLPPDIRKKYYFCSSFNKWPFTELFNKMDHKEAVPQILEFVNSDS